MKGLKRALSLGLASVMALSLFTMTAFAEGETTETVGTVDNPATGINVTKVVSVDKAGTLLPDMTFTVTMVPATADQLKDSAGNAIEDSNGKKIESGPALKTSTLEFKFDATDSTATGSASDTETFNFDFATPLDHTGVYRYYVTESYPENLKTTTDGKPTNGYITYDNTKYIVDIYVGTNSKNEIVAYNYTLRQDGATSKPENITFNNSVECQTLKIMKLVDGTEYTKDEEFTFRILIPKDGTTIVLQKDQTFTAYICDANGNVLDENGNKKTVTLKVDGDNIGANMAKYATEFKLKAGQWLELDGAPVSMIYKVEEVTTESKKADGSDLNASGISLVDEGYTTSYKYSEYGSYASADNEDTRNQDITDNGNSVQGTINTVSNEVTFTNKRTVKVDTGVSVDVIPYVLIAVIAVCGAVLLISEKKRRTNR
jgi:hypothetical protein